MTTGFHGGGGVHRDPMPETKEAEDQGADQQSAKRTNSAHICGALASGIIMIGYIFGRKSPDDDITCASELAFELHRRFEEEMGTRMCSVLRPFQQKITADPSKNEKGNCGNVYAAGAKLAVEVILGANETCHLCPEIEIPA